MVKKYQVIVNDTIVKEYPFKLQAETYCMNNGYVYQGNDEWNHFKQMTVLDGRVKIKETDT